MNFTILKPTTLRVLALLVTTLWLNSVTAQTLNTRVDTDSVSVGDVFNFSIALQLNQEYERIAFPDTSAFPTSAELIERQRFRVSEFADSVNYKFQYFNNKDLTIPSVNVVLYSANDSTTLQTEPITLFFKNVVAEGDTTLKPMAPIYAFPRLWWPWILAGIVIAAFLIWWFKFREEPNPADQENKVKIAPFYNPLKALEKELADIKEHSDIAQTKNFKKFYSEVGDAIRAYYEELYNIPALESTSSELLRYLDAYGVDDTLNEKTRIILRKADRVKFAKFTPTLEDAWQTYDKAIEFLERAKLADSARIGRLKAKYNAQFTQDESSEKQEEA